MLKKFKNFQKLVLWPNIDAGNDDISKGIRIFREKNINDNFSYSRNFSPEDYVLILKYASCAIGNSSSFIREGSFMVHLVLLLETGKLEENMEIIFYFLHMTTKI